jgi:hypothetical protein
VDLEILRVLQISLIGVAPGFHTNERHFGDRTWNFRNTGDKTTNINWEYSLIPRNIFCSVIINLFVKRSLRHILDFNFTHHFIQEKSSVNGFFTTEYNNRLMFRP